MNISRPKLWEAMSSGVWLEKFAGDLAVRCTFDHIFLQNTPFSSYILAGRANPVPSFKACGFQMELQKENSVIYTYLRQSMGCFIFSLPAAPMAGNFLFSNEALTGPPIRGVYVQDWAWTPSEACFWICPDTCNLVLPRFCSGHQIGRFLPSFSTRYDMAHALFQGWVYHSPSWLHVCCLMDVWVLIRMVPDWHDYLGVRITVFPDSPGSDFYWE